MSRESQIGRLNGSMEPIPGYQLIELLGRGGYGEVWKATAPGGVSKAIKLVLGDDRSRTSTELCALNRVKDVRHPFLLSIERIEQQPGMLAIVMELGDRNLQEHYRAYREKDLPGIPQNELLRMLRDVADVLDFIYEEFALQHLDIKPANLLLFGKRLKLADFGLVKNIYERSASLVHGLTPTYASPEIFDGQPSRASDQYSLAILYQEMLTGALPFDGTSAARLAAQHLRETPDLRSLPLEQQSVIARALSKDPQQRFPSCTTLIEELTAAVRQQPASRTGAELPFARGLLPKPPRPLGAGAAEASKSPASHPTDTPPDTHAASAEPRPTIPQSEVTPTLVIGIGGTAAHLLQRLRLRIGDRLGGIDALPAFKMMLIDTDPQMLNEANRDHSAWNELETIATPLRCSSEYRENGHLHRRWLSRRWLFNVPRSLRTDGLRPLGRLALMSSTGRVMSALRSAIMQITAVTPEDAARQAPLAPPRVIVVASVAGGTGSGMLLDLAYAARTELRLAGFSEGVVEGLLMYSTPVGAEHDKAVLNALATLGELAHFSKPGNFYPGEPLLEVPPFHGNNCTFSRTQFLHLGDGLDADAWLCAVDNAAELVYGKIATPMDQMRHSRPSNTGPALTVDAVQVRQVSGYCGRFVEDLLRQLCLDVVDGWCGQTSPPQAESLSGHTAAATIALNALENERSAKYQQLAADAEQQVQSCGVDVEQLVTRARQMLVQELAAEERKYLQTLFHEALAVATQSGKSDQEFAEMAMALQDRAIGLDFGERATDGSRNTLFELLHSRLASQAMQLASRLTGWLYDLVDQPDAGVDAARHAAETCRNYLRDLIGFAGKEIQTVQQRQSDSRILLMASAQQGNTRKSSASWLLGRGAGPGALEVKLQEHGLLCFEELLMVCVQWQLRAVESQVSAAIDQLLGLWQELKQFGKRLAVVDRDHPAEGGAPTNDEQRLRQLLLDHRHRLAKELRRRIDQDVLTGPKKLQRFVHQRGAFDHQLEGPLLQHARQVVLQTMRQVLLILLQHGPEVMDGVNIDLEATLARYIDEPLTLAGGEHEWVFVVGPTEAATGRLEQYLTTARRTVRAVPAQTNGLAVCRESAGIPLAAVVRQISHGQHAWLTLAENLHTRIDVAWDAFNAGADGCESRRPVSELPEIDNVMSTVKLS